MAFVPAVPEAVAGGFVAADLILALLAVLAWAVCYGLLSGWNYSLGFLLDKLADVLTFRVLRVNVDLGGPVRELNHVVRVSLAKGVSTADHAMGLFFYWLGLLVGWMVNFAKLSAQDTLALANWMTHIHLPKYAKWATRAAFPLAWLTKVIAQEIAKALPKVGHIAKAAARDVGAIAAHPVRAIEAEIATIEHKVGALARVVGAYAGTLVPPLHFPNPLKWLRDIRKDLTRIHKRLGKLEAGVAAGVFAATMANVLGVSARCLRKGNVGKAARRVCGMDSALLDFLLADLLAIAGVVSVVTFTEALQEIEKEAVDVLGKLIKEWPA